MRGWWHEDINDASPGMKEVMNHQIISHQRLCNPHCLRLYLMVLGLLALWEGRSEVVLGCLGALLTLSGYGDTEET